MPRHTDNTWLERISGYLKTLSERSTPDYPAESSVTSVNDTASSTMLLSANDNRKEAIVQNDSTSTLYVKYGTTASATDYSVKLGTDDVLTTEYTGRIDGIWSSDASGAAKITELT